MSWDSQRQPQKGILRASGKARRYQHSEYIENSSEKEEELLAFGYACKIFPPDDHARDIAKGRNLISWNGDENLQLLIDRYDARASLHDLSEFNRDSWNTQYEMSEEETRIEKLCDMERYMAMYTDIADERLRHEEELKRLHASILSGDESSFKEVGFNYDSTKPIQTDDAAATASSEQPTAEDAEEDQEEKPFMAPASLAIPPNMEIPPTEKMHAIIEKTATFVSGQGTQMEIILKAKQAKNSQFLFLDFDHYLNPYYKHVLQRIKEGKYSPGMKQSRPEDEEDDEDSDTDSDDGGCYLHPSLFASSHKVKEEEEERKKEKLKAIQKVDPDHPLAKLIEKGRKANALKQYNIMKTTVLNFNPGKEDALEPPPLPKFMESAPNLSNCSSPLTLQDRDALPPSITPQEAAMVIVPPPPDIQPMVDSVAKQIAEEGAVVEQTMRDKKDPLLAFLEPSHELHPYYTFRKTFIREQAKAQKRLLQQIQAQEAKEAIEAEKDKQSAPICFSIKGKKEQAPKTTLISTRLQALGGDSDEEKGEGENKSENKENEKDSGDSSKSSEDSKPATKRKFVEISVVEGIAKPSEKKAALPPQSTMTEEDRKRLPAQTKRTFSDGPPPNVVVTPNSSAPSISSFNVVTPDGNTMSIAEFREKQAERRKKVALLALQGTKKSAVNIKTETAQQKNLVSQDIFDIFEEEDSKSDIKKTDPLETSPTKDNSASSRIPASNREPTPPPKSPSAERKSSPVPLAPPAMTLKDLVVAASQPSPPRDGKHRRSRSKSHEKSRSRSRSKQSSPYDHSRKRSARSRSRERDYVPSVHKRILASSSSRAPSTGHSRYKDDENLPSAYKIENRPAAYGNGNYSRSRRWEPSPTGHRSHKRHHYDFDKDGSHKRHHYDSDKDDEKKKRRSHSSPSHKSKKHSKSKKKHKKKKSKNKKKMDKNILSEEGEWSSDCGSSSRNAEKRVKIKEASVDNASSPKSMPKVEKEDGELTPRQSNDMVKS